MEDSELKKSLTEIHAKLDQFRSDSVIREKRVSDRLEQINMNVRKAQETADKAHAIALDAKHAAHRASESSEGTDHTIFAELGSLKVVLNETTTAITKLKEEMPSAEDRAKERKSDMRSRKFWRVAQPAILTILVALSNMLLIPRAPVRPIIPTSGVDAGLHFPQ